MKANVILSEPVPVFVAPVNDATQKWGVYALPWMWRCPDGKYILTVNGHQDTLSPDYRQELRNMFFISEDDGTTWQEIDRNMIAIPSFTCTEPPYTRLKNGESISLQFLSNNKNINNISCLNTVINANREIEYAIYRYGDIPENCKEMKLLRFDEKGKEISAEKVTLDYPEHLLQIVAGARLTDGQNTLVEAFESISERKMHSYNTIQSIIELPDGTLGGTVYSHVPIFEDKEYENVEMVVSEDGGKTWKKRAEIAGFDPDVEFGYSYENSMVVAPNGDLLCVMRTEHCVPKDIEPNTCAMFSRSADNGHTWTKPVPIASGSVTPHLISLKNGVVVLVYGRPGVHIKYSTDSGKTWSEPVSVIGKTLEEHMVQGDDYMDCKYWDMDTYANTFVEVLSDDTFLMCYTDTKYQTGDGLNHKATLVRKITVTPEKE